MKGTNPIRPPANDDGKMLDIKAIFLTIQGEGPNAGTPAIFVRLGGCNLACDFCDTEFEEFSTSPIEEIVNEVVKLSLGFYKFVVITGGEPLRQNISPFCDALIKNGFRIQIETNGTLYRKLADEVEIICSPKNTGTGYIAIRPDLAQRINYYKFIVSATHPLYLAVPKTDKPVYIQPMDELDEEKNAANIEYAKKLVLNENYKLSLQLHKILGLP